MKTVQEIINLTISHLEQNDVQHPRRNAEDIIAAVLGMPRLDIYMNFDRPLADEELSRCRDILARRVKGEPLQYILGTVDFYGCTITVASDVLIPRQETELLVDMVAETLANENLEGKAFADICCGSGCIGIAIKKKFPELDVILSDIDGKALEIAKKNADDNGVDVTFFQGDLVEALGTTTVDYVVCNPPYVTEEEYAGLEREVRDYEPRGALVSGQTGLECYRRLADELPSILNEKALVWLEIGVGQGENLGDIFADAPWHDGITSQDYAGNDRFFIVTIDH